jgi:hypothetical protein
MTDNDTLADNNIKHFGKQVSCYRYPTGVESEPILCHSACLECRNDHRFTGNIEHAITFIDLLPDLFPGVFKSNRGSSISINQLQEFVN